jgi:hypothetical protein
MSIDMTLPTGTGDGVFTYQDLLQTAEQDAWSTFTYFGNDSDTIICTDSVLNPDVQWCAPQAAIENIYLGMAVHITHHEPGPPVIAEPRYDVVVVMLVLAVFISLRKIWRIKSGR